MNKSKKIIMIVVGVIAIIAVVIALMVSCEDKNVENETTTAETTTGEVNTVIDDIEDPGDLEIPETDENGEIVTEIETTKKKKKEDKETTNYWDNIEVYEDGGDTEPLIDENGETMTDENGEVVTEEYPGQNQGWSPIVKPEDLE